MVALAVSKIGVAPSSGSVGVNWRDLNTEVEKEIVDLDDCLSVPLPGGDNNRRFVEAYCRNDQSCFAKEDV